MKLKSTIKFIVSIVMLGLVLRMTNFDKLKDTLSHTSVFAVIGIVIIYAVGQIISSYKWWTIARAAGITTSYPVALKSYFIGMFVNCFGFGTLGGDIARGILLAEDKPVKTTAVASVIADRAHGLATLAMIGAASVAVFGLQMLEPLYAGALVLFSVGIFSGWFIAPKIVRALLPVHNPLREKVELVLRVLPSHIPTVLYITIISILFHTLQISIHKLMGLAIGIDVPWSYLLVAIPFVNILSTLPISWNGLGVRENAYVFFLSPAVLSREQALAFGAIWIIAVTFCSAVGGIVSVMTRDFDKIRTEEERLEAQAAPESTN